MKVAITQQHMNNYGINIDGPHVTELVWGIFNYSIRSNRYDCFWYKARTKASAFFQGGSDDPKGEWVFIEFLGLHQEELARTSDYLALVNNALEYIADDGKAKEVMVVINDATTRQWVRGICRFYEVPLIEKENEFSFTPSCSHMITSLVERELSNADNFKVIKS